MITEGEQKQNDNLGVTAKLELKLGQTSQLAEKGAGTFGSVQ